MGAFNICCQKKRAEEAAADGQGQHRHRQSGGSGNGGKVRNGLSNRDELAQALRDNILSQVTPLYYVG